MTAPLTCMLAFLAACQGAPSSRPGQDECVPAQPSRVWSAIVPASVKTRVEPQWPVLDAYGVVVLDVWIDERGEVTCVKVIRSLVGHDRAAVEAVRKWKFAPATLHGQPVAVVQVISLLKRL